MPKAKLQAILCTSLVTTPKLDSLKVLENTFIVSRDTLGTGYNQVKGQNLYGKFEEGKLHVDIVKNAEVIYICEMMPGAHWH
jgi:hypothetical protein